MNHPADPESAKLRAKAEAALEGKAIASGSMRREEVDRILHELQVHQIELELQNDELRRTQSELDASRREYAELYHQAPVGYLTLDKVGIIVQVNHTLCELTGWPANQLVARSLVMMVHPEDKDRFYKTYRRYLRHRRFTALDVRMRRAGGGHFHAHLEGRAVDDFPNDIQCLVTVSDISELVEARRMLQESEARYRLLANNAHDTIIRHSLEGVIRYISPAVRSTLGHDHEALIDTSKFDLVHPDDLPDFRQLLQEGLEREGVCTATFRARAAGDGYRWVETTSRLTPEASGHDAPEVITVMRDITGRREAEEERDAHRRFLEAIQHAAFDSMAVFDREHTLLWSNRAGSTIHCDQDGAAAWRPETEEDERTISQARERVFNSAEPAEYELRVMDDTGQRRIFWTHASPLPDARGRVAAVVESSREITALLAAQSALRRSAWRLAEAHRMARIGAWEWLADSGELLLSEELCELLEMPAPKGAVDLHVLCARYKPEHGERLRAAVGRVVRDNGTAEMALEAFLPSGRHVFHSIRVGSLQDGSGKRHLLGTVQDITREREAEEERRRIEEQMQRTQKLESLGVLAGGIAHDFNNLLMAVIGNADMALEDLERDTETWRCVHEIGLAAERAADLARQMLAYSGRGNFVNEEIDLSELVREMCQLLSVSVNKRASLHYDFDEAIPRFHGDPTQIRQVVMNLITNASEALEGERGTIHINTGAQYCDRTYLATAFIDDALEEGEYAYIEVRDSGCGMTPETVKNMFDPFFTTKFAGRGLGMAAVLGIVRGHRGAIRVDSTPKKGTSVRVLIPAALPPGRSAVRKHDGIAPRFHGRVLLVDDDAAILRVASRMLERLGLTVNTAGEGQQALEKLAQDNGAYDVIVLDLTMPRMDGAETLRRLRQIYPAMPVIIASGYHTGEVTAQFAGFEGVYHLHKPYQLHALRDALGRVLPESEHTSG